MSEATITAPANGAADVDGAFAAALAHDAKTAPPQTVTPPPPRHTADPDAPHGRDEDGNPLAPYGLNQKTGKPNLKRPGPGRGGKRAKGDEPRTREALPGEATGKAGQAAALEPHDFSAALMEAGEMIWFGGSMVAKVGPQVPVLGRFVPGRKLAATMAVFDAERPRLAAAVNLAAQHDARARKLAARLSAGEVGWALSCVFMVAPFASTVAAVWQGDAALAERELPGLDELGKANDAALDRMLAKIASQMQAAQAQAQAQAQEAAA